MSELSSIYTIMESELKEQAEQVPSKQILDYSTLSQEQFDAEMKKGYDSIKAGRLVSAKHVRKHMQRQFKS